MTNEFDPLKELSDISEDEMNEFIAQQRVVTKKHRRQKPRESFVCFISFYESIKLMPERLHLKSIQSIDGLCILSGGTAHKDTSTYYAIFRQLAEAGGRELTKI